MEQKIRVLIVDDDASTRETYKEIFSWAGFDVRDVPNGEQGLEAIEALHPDVVFTGIEMPGMSGFELIEKVRAFDGAIPKMVINSHTDKEEDRKRARGLRVDGYFVRGFAAPKNVVNHIFKITGRTGAANGKVLIVDDDASTRETYKEVLRWAGFETFEAVNGQEAMDLIDTVKPDVIFTGIMMPKMNGFELVRNVRKLAKKQPYVIINSHTDNEDDRKQAAQLGVDGYFVRGFSAPRNVVNHIKKLLLKYEPSMLDASTTETPVEKTSMLTRDVLYLALIVLISLCFILALLYASQRTT